LHLHVTPLLLLFHQALLPPISPMPTSHGRCYDLAWWCGPHWGRTQQSPWFHHPGWHLADFTSAAVRGDSAVGLPSAPPYRRHHGVRLPDRLPLVVVAVRVVRLPANGCRLQRCLLSCCMVIDGGHWVTADGFYGELRPLRAQRLVVFSLSSSENLLSSMLANNDSTCGCRSPPWRHCREVLGETSPPSSPQHCVAYRGLLIVVEPLPPLCPVLVGHGGRHDLAWWRGRPGQGGARRTSSVPPSVATARSGSVVRPLQEAPWGWATAHGGGDASCAA
jgi:hypothetical protein